MRRKARIIRQARDSPATTIASHSPKKGGFQAAGRRSPDSSLPSKISTEACRSRWKAFLWRNGERGRKAPGTGRGRPEPCRSLLRHRPLWPGRGRLKDSPPVTDCGWTDRRLYDEGDCCLRHRRDAGTPCIPLTGHWKSALRKSDKTKTSRSHAGDVLANSGARDGT